MTGHYVQMATLRIDTARLDDYRAAVARHADAALAQEPGVLALQAVADPDDPAQVFVFEVYRNKDAYLAHLQTPHFLAYKKEVEDMVLSLTLTPFDPLHISSKAMP